MKGRGKPRGIKYEIREQRRRNQRATLAAILIAVVSVSGFITYSILNQSSPRQVVSYKAAIVDQLSGTFPNPSFNNNAKTVLVGAGYTVDYYSPDQVTVEFLRSLPSKDYGIIIIRAHSTGYATVPGQEVTIFTSEAYDPGKYVDEQLTDHIARASLGSVEQAKLGLGQLYFAIPPAFVEDSMQGRFPNSIIIMMGCTGLKDLSMAQAFVDRGARVYVSWNDGVTAGHTDVATEHLLEHLLGKKQTIASAITDTMKEVGADPVYHSQLLYYPLDVGSA